RGRQTVADPIARTLSRLGRIGEGVDSLSDAELLRRYVATRDGEAFAGIVRRFGPMVFGVCRRVLGHAHDAEDAFQATFIVLARKASSIRASGLSRWLYGVAVKVAHKARAQRARRLARQAQLTYVAEPAVNAMEPTDWLPLLDGALAKLSSRDRLPILLCDLRGMSRIEAAAELGIAEGTLSSRLARARDKLRTKLSRLGPVLSLPALIAGLTDRATAIVPNALIESTVAAAAPAARELAEGGLRTMFLAKLLKLSGAGVGALGARGHGVTAL